MSDRGDVDSGGDHQHEGEEIDDGKGRGGGRGEYRRFRPRYVRRGGSRNYNKPEGEDGEQHLEEHQARTPIKGGSAVEHLKISQIYSGTSIVQSMITSSRTNWINWAAENCSFVD